MTHTRASEPKGAVRAIFQKKGGAQFCAPLFV